MLKLQQLNFKNWIPFYGNQKIVFSTDEKKKVTFINADNQAGKTAILRGILWCMFGDTNDDDAYLEHISRLNLQAKSENDYSYHVELKLKFNNQDYVIIRSAELQTDEVKESNWDVVLTCNIDSIDYEGMNAQQKINEIFDISTSRFYLFDGEMLQEYRKLIKTNNMSTLGKKIISSIEDILRITTLRNAKSSLQIIHNNAVKAANKDKNKDAKIQQAYTTIESYQKELDILFDEEKNLKVQRRDKERLAEEARKELDNNPEQQQLAKEVKELTDTLIPNCKTSISDLENTVRRNASFYYTKVIEKDIKKIKNNVQRKLNELLDKQEKFKKIDIFQSLLNDKDISSDSKEVIKNQIPNFNEKDREGLTDEIFNLKGQLLNIEKFDASQANREIIVDKYLNLKNQKENLEILEARYEEIIDRFGSEDNVDLADKLWETFATNKELIGQIERELDVSVEGSNANKIAELQKLKSQIETTIPKDRVGSLSANREMLARRYRDFFDACIDALVNNTKSTIQEAANNMYSQLSEYRVLLAQEKTGLNLEVTENFGLQVKTSDGEALEASAGGSQIVALSLIWALRSQLQEAPLLMDTPFGRLDKKFREAFLTIGPKMGTQFILLVQDGEVEANSDLHQIIYPHIGLSYKLNKMTDKVTEITQL